MEKMTMRDMHRVDKPREKLARYGPGRLSDVELLAILLGSGKKGFDVLSLAQKITSTFSNEQLLQIDTASLLKISGIGPAKASIILAAIEFSRRLTNVHEEKVLTPADVWARLETIRAHTKEHFIVFLLNSRNYVIKQEVVSVGIVDTSLIHPREIFEPAIKHVASSMILCHNHPSGEVQPSDADLHATQQLLSAGKLLGIPIYDHVIVSQKGYFSFKEHNLL